MGKRRSRGEGSIFKNSDGLWVARITLPNGQRKQKTSKTQSVVREWLIEQRKALADGILVDDQKITVAEFIGRWLTDVKAPLLRESTLATHESIIRTHIYPELGYLRLRNLSPAHLQALYSKRLKEGKSKRTVKYIHTILHQSLDQALKWGLIARNPADAVDSPVPDRRPVEPLTYEAVARLFEILKNDRLYPLYVTFLG